MVFWDLFISDNFLNDIKNYFSFNLSVDSITLMLFNFVTPDYSVEVILNVDTTNFILIHPLVTQIMLFFMYIVIFYFILLNLTSLVRNFILKKKLYKLAGSDFINFLFESEKEIVAFDDICYFLFSFIFIFICFLFFGFFFFNFFFLNNMWLFSLLIFLLTSIITIPLEILTSLGFLFIMYLRGGASRGSFLMEVVFDWIGVLLGFSRFLIQNMRLILTFFAFLELFEWFYLNNQSNIFFYHSFYSLSTLDIIIQVLLIITHYLYVVIHLYSLIFMQITVYFVITFWLLFFIHTCHFYLYEEYYFLFKKNTSN